MSKYQKLGDYLDKIPLDTFEETITFERIQRIISTDLPKSAYEYRCAGYLTDPRTFHRDFRSPSVAIYHRILSGRVK